MLATAHRAISLVPPLGHAPTVSPRMHLRTRPHPLALAGAVLSLLAPSLRGQTGEPSSRDVSDGWSVMAVTDSLPRWETSIADARWPVASLTDSWRHQGLAGHTGTVWYRKHVELPAGLTTPAARPAVLVGALSHGAYRVYVDGVLVGSHGGEDDLVPFPRSQVFELPRGVIADGQVLLTLEVLRRNWAAGIAGNDGPAFQGAVIGSAEPLQQALADSQRQDREHDLPGLLFAMVAVTVGVLHLVLYCTRRSQTEYLWFGAAAVAFAVNALAFSPWSAEVFHGFGTPYRLTSATGHLATALLLLFLLRIFPRPRRRLIDAYVLSHVALALFVLASPLSWSVATAQARFLWLFPGLALAILLLVTELRDGNPDATALGIGTLAVVAAEGAEFLRLSGAPLPAFLPYAGFTLAILSVTALLAGRYARHMEALDTLRQTLEARVTERTAALAEATLKAQVANEAKSRFLTNMSHELRTPLNGVIGFANVLLKRARSTGGHLGPRELDFLERIRSNGMHLLALVDRVLDLSMVEAGVVTVEHHTTQLTQLVNQVLADMSPLSQRRRVTLTAAVPTSAEPVLTDPVRLRQILTALVDNGIRFTEGGTVTVSLSVDVQHRPVRIQVRDTGPGIPPDRLAEVMEAFALGDDSPSRLQPGMGLGLTISRALCDLLGYRLTLESEVGVGTVATVELQASTPPRGGRTLPPSSSRLAPEHQPTPGLPDD